MPKVFYLMRDEDVSGVSGTGKVAEGIQFSNGKVAISWCKDVPSVTVYDTIEQVVKTHGHEGKTRLVFIDCLKDCE